MLNALTSKLVASEGRRSSRKVGFLSLVFGVACGEPSPGPAGTSGGAPSAGGSANSGVGGSATFGGSSVGSGGAPVQSQGGAATTGGMAGQTAGGQSGGASPASGGQAAGGASAGASSGGASTGGAAGATTGGSASGGAAGATTGGSASGGASTGGRGGASSGGQAGSAGATSSGCKGGKVVHFVYFVESDQTENAKHRADIEKQAFAFQNYWFQQLGVTFYLNEPVVDVIKADHPSSWYLTNPDGIHSDQRWYRLGNVKNEVYRKLGISNFDANHRVVNYPTTRNDGRVGGNFGGAWMDGDDMTCIATNGVNYPYDDGSSAHCLGHVAHEFGHVLGLDHEGPMTDCMQYGFYVSPGGAMCNFSAANTAKIKADSDNAGWFKAMPGQTCTAD